MKISKKILATGTIIVSALALAACGNQSASQKKKQVLNCKFSELPRISTIVVNKTRNTSGLENILNGYARIGVLCAGQSEQEQKNAPVASKELFKRFSKESKDATFGAVNANQEIDELLEKWNDPMLKKLLLMYKICEWKVFEGSDNRYRKKFLDAVRKEVGNHLRNFPDTYRKFWFDNLSVRRDLDAFLSKPLNSTPSDNLIRKFFYGKALGGRFNNYTNALLNLDKAIILSDEDKSLDSKYNEVKEKLETKWQKDTKNIN